MALIICPECGRTISDKAAACIGCGCPVSEMNMETVQPAGRAQRRRRYQPEVTAEAPAQPAFDQAAFDAALQDCFTGDVPIKLPTPVRPAQSSEEAQKSGAIQRLAQVASMAAAQQSAGTWPVQAAPQQMLSGAVQAAPENCKAAPARPAPANMLPAGCEQVVRASVQTAPVLARPLAYSPAPAQTAPANAAVSVTPAVNPSVSKLAPSPAPAQTAPANAAVSVTPAVNPSVSKLASSPAPAATAPANAAAASTPDDPPPSEPARTVPSEMPEYGIIFGTIMTLLRQGIGVLSYAAAAAVVAMVVELLSSGSVSTFVEPEILLGLLGGYAIAGLVVNLDFLRARRFLRKGGYLDAIRNDGPEMTNCINAYRLYPSRAMIWYIKRLNPAHGAKIAQWAKEGKQERRNARLRYLLRALLLGVVFYFLPRYEMIYDLMPMLAYNIPLYLTPVQLLLIEHLITLVVVILYAEKNSPDLDTLNLEVLIVFAGVFALMLYVYDMGDLWYHIIINAAVVFVAFIIGGIWYAKKKN